MGDIIYVKTPQERCTTKFKTVCIIKVKFSQSVQVDIIPWHVKDLHPFRRSYSLSEHGGDSIESELLVDLGLSSLGDHPDNSSSKSDTGELNDLLGSD